LLMRSIKLIIDLRSLRRIIGDRSSRCFLAIFTEDILRNRNLLDCDDLRVDQRDIFRRSYSNGAVLGIVFYMAFVCNDLVSSLWIGSIRPTVICLLLRGHVLISGKLCGKLFD